MRRSKWLCGVLAGALLAGCVSRPPLYHVRRVIDGDTIEIVDAGGIRNRVRLRKYDAPEMREPGGPEAKAALVALVEGRDVEVKPVARGRWGRVIASVRVAGRDVAEIMKAAGHVK